jgi:hypothetical protein
MKKVTTESTLGNYKAVVSVDADEALQEILQSFGLKYVLQRQQSIDTTLGAFQMVNGKRKRKVGWKRNDVDYSTAVADSLQAALSKLAMPDSEIPLAVNVDVLEYIRDVAIVAFTEERALMTRHESDDDLESWLVNRVKYDGPSHGDDGEFNIDALKAVREFKKAALAGL